MTNAPFTSRPMGLEPDWIDYNGHLNMAYYNVLFDSGVDEVWDDFGFGTEYREATGNTTFAAEVHVCYLRELHPDARVRVTFQILDFDDKRLHFYQEIIHEDGWVSATCEGMSLHIDSSGPRVAPYPADIYTRIQNMAAQHATLPRPERVGRVIGISKKA